MPAPKTLPYTEDNAANALLAKNPTALLIGLVLYQQVPIEKAFSGPAELERRIGKPLQATTIAAMDPGELEAAFREKPALHRFPAAMAKRVYAMCETLVDEFGGDPTKLWKGAGTADEVIARMTSLPGFGDYKARVYFGVLAERFGVRPDGWEEYLPDWPSIVDIEKSEDLADLKARKKAWKAASGG